MVLSLGPVPRAIVKELGRAIGVLVVQLLFARSVYHRAATSHLELRRFRLMRCTSLLPLS